MTSGDQKIKYRVGTGSIVGIVGLAMLADLFQIFITLTGVGILITFYIGFVASFSIALWFALCGVGYTSGKKAASKLVTSLSTAIIELIPLIDALPVTSIGAGVIIYLSREEDRERAEKKAAAMKAEMEAIQTQQERHAAYIRKDAAVAANDATQQEEVEAA